MIVLRVGILQYRLDRQAILTLDLLWRASPARDRNGVLTDTVRPEAAA